MNGLLSSTYSAEQKEVYKGARTRYGNNKKLVEADIPEIFYLHYVYKMTCKAIAHIYKVTESCISKVIRGDTWSKVKLAGQAQ